MNFLALNRTFLIAFFAIAITISVRPAWGENSAASQTSRDNALGSVRRSDAASRTPDGKLSRLGAAEHMRRASIYMANRAFSEAREHWQAVIDYYPQDAHVPEALFGIARSYFQSRAYAEAFTTFDRLARSFGSTKEGREGLNFSGASLLRLGKPSEAVDRYIEYIDRYPNGERIETAYLNVIDTLREAGRPQEALAWVEKTRARFPGSATDANALFTKLRLYIAEGNWAEAVNAADQLRRLPLQRGVMTSSGELAYLKAFSLEKAGRKDEAFSVYASIPDGVTSYYGGLATDRMLALANARTRSVATARASSVDSAIALAEADYPAPYRASILRAAKSRKIDPRFVLALMRQESVFRPTAKSQSGARGLLQLTIDAAQKYAADAGLKQLQETQLYDPDASIRVGVEYLSHLSRMFPGMPEAIAASYNGGEDNVARWVQRAGHKDPGVFTAEVGFDETKAYVQKVMANYRVYRQLYNPDLKRK